MFHHLLLLSIFAIVPINCRQSIDFSLKSAKNSQVRLTLLDFSTSNQLVKWSNLRNSSIVRGTLPLGNTTRNVLLRFDQPDWRQKYIAIDLLASHLTVDTDDYRLKMAVSSRRDLFPESHAPSDNTGCSCVHGNCACCIATRVPAFMHTACVNATYNPQTIGLDLSIGIDGHYFSEEISVRNPPPVCFALPIPEAEHIVGACVAFTDLDLNKKAKILSGCVEFEVELVHLRVLHFKMGCFRMPI